MVEVFKEPFHRGYHSPRLSFAYLISVVGNVLLVTLPFFLAYPFHENGTIWLKQDTYWEQPRVKYTYKYVATLLAKDRVTGKTKELYYSSFPSANMLRGESTRIATLRSREIDEDFDGVIDQTIASITFPLLKNEEIYSAQAVLLFDYRLEDRVLLDTVAVVHTKGDSGVSRNGFIAIGDIDFKQSYPMEIRDEFSKVYADDPIWNDDDLASDIQKTDIVHTMERFSRRTYVAQFQPDYNSWTNNGDINIFNLTMVVNIPRQEIHFVPKAVDVLKEAWVKYLSLFVIVNFVVRACFSFIYSHQM